MRIVCLCLTAALLLAPATAAQVPVISFEGEPLQGLCGSHVRQHIPEPRVVVALTPQFPAIQSGTTLVLDEVPDSPTPDAAWQLVLDFDQPATRNTTYTAARDNGAWLVVGRHPEAFVGLVFIPLHASVDGDCLIVPGTPLTAKTYQRFPRKVRRFFAQAPTD